MILCHFTSLKTENKIRRKIKKKKKISNGLCEYSVAKVNSKHTNVTAFLLIKIKLV